MMANKKAPPSMGKKRAVGTKRTERGAAPKSNPSREEMKSMKSSAEISRKAKRLEKFEGNPSHGGGIPHATAATSQTADVESWALDKSWETATAGSGGQSRPGKSTRGRSPKFGDKGKDTSDEVRARRIARAGKGDATGTKGVESRPKKRAVGNKPAKSKKK